MPTTWFIVHVCFYLLGALGHAASVWPLRGLENRDKVGNGKFHIYMMALSKNPGYQDLDEFPWVAILGVCFHEQLLEELSVNSTEGERLEAVPCHSWIPPRSFPFADFNLCPFVVINGNLEHNVFSSLSVLSVNQRSWVCSCGFLPT